jgi:thymidylate synthase
MVVRIPQDIYKEINGEKHEPPCLTILDTEVNRDETDNELKFVLTGYWRSWDAYGALPANLAGLQLFSETFVKELNTRGREKHGPAWKEITTGKMIMHSKNCHVYQRQFPLVEELLKAKKSTFGEKIQLNKKT